MKSKAFILSIFVYFLIAFSSYANMFDWNAKKIVDASTTICNCNQGLADLVEAAFEFFHGQRVKPNTDYADVT